MPAKGNINAIVYVKEKLTESQHAQIRNTKLVDVVRQLGIPLGRIEAIDDKTVAIYETDNFVLASLKMTLLEWCVVESFLEQHPRLNPNLGNLARGSN